MTAAGRSVRRLYRLMIFFAGPALVLAGALATATFDRLVLCAAGTLLLLGAGLALEHRMVPSDRRLTALRAELDAFVAATRKLNALAVAATEGRGDVATFHAACDDLMQRARHIGTVTAATHGLSTKANRTGLHRESD